MKKNQFKLTLTAFGIFLMFMGSTSILKAKEKEPLCGWDDQLQFCIAGALDGYCAYGGPDCTTTIPTVEG